MLVKPVCYNNNYLGLAKKHSSLEGLDGHMKKRNKTKMFHYRENIIVEGKADGLQL